RYHLPDPPSGQELVDAVRASLGLLDLAADRITIPAFAGIWRAVLGPVDLSLWFSGPTGAFKSEFASLIQRHYGAGMDRLHLPSDWKSTDNALELLAFQAKDAVLVIDDFAPSGTQLDIQRLHAKADRVLRGQ